MIKNDRQYRVTKTQAQSFDEALANFSKHPAPAGVDPILVQAQRNALEAQYNELVEELREYEALQSGEVTNLRLEDLSQLPPAIIKARIAVGLTHRELAERLGLKEQQIQRWEANDYSGVSIETLKSIMSALGVETREELFLPTKEISGQAVLSHVEQAGVPRSLILNKILSPSLAYEVLNNSFAGLVRFSEAVSRIFGIKMPDLLSLAPIDISFRSVALARFKMPSRANEGKVNAYTVYAHYIAALVERCAAPEVHTVSLDCHKLHEALSAKGKPMNLAGVLEYIWGIGIIVIPLKESGAFHGAVWKIRSRFVIVLKQSTLLESRWLFDLLHELAHIALGHVTEDTGIVEIEPISMDMKDAQEEEANEWAEDTLFDGDSEEIEQACDTRCRGSLQKLKQTLPCIASEFNVNLGALANHMAFRLASEGKDWWGTAHNLQREEADPFVTAREYLFKNIRLNKLNALDNQLLITALTEE